ncbi:hypothetical protein [Halomonas salina]|uniref:hypothetical protein n=1 Tax=Halomonas salina TaxID=42565 RepID=UPI00126831F3|nr:hypothetical protein [Halomonas salina]
MTVKALVFSVAVASMFIAPTFAATGDNPLPPPMLKEGVSSTQLLRGEPRRYRVVIDRPSSLEISSEHLAGEHQGEGEYKQIKATLYDASGKMVTTASDLRGHFRISERVQPGEYILEVTGRNLSGSSHETSTRRYNLHVDFE